MTLRVLPSPTPAGASPSSAAAAEPSRWAELRQCDPELRRQVTAVRAWALGQGRAVEADALTLVFAAARPGDWTEAKLTELVWTGCWRCAHALDEEAPAGVGEALWAALGWLASVDGLGPTAAPLPRLHAVLVANAGLDAQGRARRSRSRPPAGPRRWAG
ncbi:MAG: hypothetical protein ACKVWR_11665 [Acidimicrobiales bacterium]